MILPTEIPFLNIFKERVCRAVRSLVERRVLCEIFPRLNKTMANESKMKKWKLDRK